MSGTILAYRNDPERPVAEIRLASGDQVRISLHAAGMVIEGLAPPPAREIIRADADQVARLCAGMLAPGQRRDPLALLAVLVSHLGSTTEIREAFAAALAALD